MRTCKIDEGWIQTPRGGKSLTPGEKKEWDVEWPGTVGGHGRLK